MHSQQFNSKNAVLTDLKNQVGALVIEVAEKVFCMEPLYAAGHRS